MAAQALRSPEDDKLYAMRPMSTEGQTTLDMASLTDAEKDLLVAKRNVDPQDVVIHRKMQQSVKNTIGHSELSGMSPETRIRAIDAFVLSPPADISEGKKVELTGLSAWAVSDKESSEEVFGTNRDLPVDRLTRPIDTNWSRFMIRIYDIKVTIQDAWRNMERKVMTEIQFLIELLLNHKMSPDVKKLCTERIGEVASRLGQLPAPAQLVRHPGPPSSLDQSPSTLALMAKHAADELGEPIVAKTLPRVQRIVGGEVSTGNGTRGPRKF